MRALSPEQSNQHLAGSEAHALIFNTRAEYRIAEYDDEGRLGLKAAPRFRSWGELAELCTKLARELVNHPAFTDILNRELPEDMRNFLDWLPDWGVNNLLSAMENAYDDLCLKYLGKTWSLDRGPHVKHAEIDLQGVRLLEEGDSGEFVLCDPLRPRENPALNPRQIIVLLYYCLSDERTLIESAFNYGPFLAQFLPNLKDPQLSESLHMPPVPATPALEENHTQASAANSPRIQEANIKEANIKEVSKATQGSLKGGTTILPHAAWLQQTQAKLERLFEKHGL